MPIVLPTRRRLRSTRSGGGVGLSAAQDPYASGRCSAPDVLSGRPTWRRMHTFFFSSRRRHTRFDCDWSSDVCSSDLTWSCGKIKGGRLCTFDGGVSSDDHGVTGWSWNFGDGTTGSGIRLTKTFGSRTTYTVELTVQDAEPLTNSKSCAVQTGTSGTC